ncbi:MAG: hypothetical protein OEQ25_07590 [Gammaproteobacteria bacterium]|nr:hypothetical protein [Gammaproteobacteria bacterium]MDH3506988.1 hypothetical protein [Gammaproteobacteria bacterium]
MRAQRTPKRWHTGPAALWTQAALGALALAVGVLVYVLDRPAEQLPLLSAFNFADVTPVVFGVVGGSLPTFAHTFAFSLLTAAWLCGGKRAGLWACLTWFGIDSAFEIGQQPQIAVHLVEIVPGWFEYLPFLPQADSYFLSGTFDAWDLISIALGAVAAYFITGRSLTGYR